jgi:hypothetical protein
MKFNKFLIVALGSVSLGIAALPVRANKYPEYQLIQGPVPSSVCSSGSGTTNGSGLTTFNCRNGKYKWCPNGKQFFTTKNGDEGCRSY